MTKHELGEELRHMYSDALPREKVAMIHLFGIKYADEIKQSKVNCIELTKLAKICRSYATEINKGMKLSKYVKLVY